MTSSRFAVQINKVLFTLAALLVGAFLLSSPPIQALVLQAPDLPAQFVSTEVGSKDVEHPRHVSSQGSSDHCNNGSAQNRHCQSSGGFAMATAVIQLIVLAPGHALPSLNHDHLWLAPFYKIENPPD